MQSIMGIHPIFQEPFYLAPAMAFSVMTLILLLLPMPKGKEWHEFRRGYPYILVAFVVMLLLTGAHSLSPAPGPGLFNIMILAIAYYQAILFGMGLALLLDPARGIHRFLVHIITVSISTVAMLVIHFTTSDSISDMVFGVYVGGYVVLFSYYLRLWKALYRSVVARVDTYYDEDMASRLLWLKRLMFAVLLVGALALVTSIFIQFNPYFVIFYTLCYAYFLTCIIRLTMTGSFLMKAVESKEVVEDTSSFEENGETGITEIFGKVEDGETSPSAPHLSVRERRLESALEQWVQEKQYAATDMGVDEIAHQLGTNYAALTQYFQRHKGTTFRSWRTELRLEEAKRLLVEEPLLSVNEIMDMVGFNDRGNFYRHFQRTEGCSPSAYRQARS